jgi:hypothetical protein
MVDNGAGVQVPMIPPFAQLDTQIVGQSYPNNWTPLWNVMKDAERTGFALKPDGTVVDEWALWQKVQPAYNAAVKEARAALAAKFLSAEEVAAGAKFQTAVLKGEKAMIQELNWRMEDFIVGPQGQIRWISPIRSEVLSLQNLDHYLATGVVRAEPLTQLEITNLGSKVPFQLDGVFLNTTKGTTYRPESGKIVLADQRAEFDLFRLLGDGQASLDNPYLVGLLDHEIGSHVVDNAKLSSGSFSVSNIQVINPSNTSPYEKSYFVGEVPANYRSLYPFLQELGKTDSQLSKSDARSMLARMENLMSFNYTTFSMATSLENSQNAIKFERVEHHFGVNQEIYGLVVEFQNKLAADPTKPTTIVVPLPHLDANATSQQLVEARKIAVAEMKRVAAYSDSLTLEAVIQIENNIKPGSQLDIALADQGGSNRFIEDSKRLRKLQSVDNPSITLNADGTLPLDTTPKGAEYKANLLAGMTHEPNLFTPTGSTTGNTAPLPQAANTAAAVESTATAKQVFNSLDSLPADNYPVRAEQDKAPINEIKVGKPADFLVRAATADSVILMATAVASLQSVSEQIARAPTVAEKNRIINQAISASAGTGLMIGGIVTAAGVATGLLIVSGVSAVPAAALVGGGLLLAFAPMTIEQITDPVFLTNLLNSFKPSNMVANANTAWKMASVFFNSSYASFSRLSKAQWNTRLVKDFVHGLKNLNNRDWVAVANEVSRKHSTNVVGTVPNTTSSNSNTASSFAENPTNPTSSRAAASSGSVPAAGSPPAAPPPDQGLVYIPKASTNILIIPTTASSAGPVVNLQNDMPESSSTTVYATDWVPADPSGSSSSSSDSTAESLTFQKVSFFFPFKVIQRDANGGPLKVKWDWDGAEFTKAQGFGLGSDTRLEDNGMVGERSDGIPYRLKVTQATDPSVAYDAFNAADGTFKKAPLGIYTLTSVYTAGNPNPQTYIAPYAPIGGGPLDINSNGFPKAQSPAQVDVTGAVPLSMPSPIFGLPTNMPFPENRIPVRTANQGP